MRPERSESRWGALSPIMCSTRRIAPTDAAANPCRALGSGASLRHLLVFGPCRSPVIFADAPNTLLLAFGGGSRRGSGVCLISRR
jgi:hypothetical protein